MKSTRSLVARGGSPLGRPNRVPAFAVGDVSENAVEAVEAMQYRGFIAMKTRDRPVGAKIVLDLE